MEIDLAGRVYSERLYARLAWQELFSLYIKAGGDIDNLDNMLCDYDSLANLIKESSPDTDSTYIWAASKCGTTFAERNSEAEEWFFPYHSYCEVMAKVTYNWKTITIVVIDGEGKEVE